MLENTANTLGYVILKGINHKMNIGSLGQYEILLNMTTQELVSYVPNIAQQRLCSFLFFFQYQDSDPVTTRVQLPQCLRLRTCRICRWGWRCRPSQRSPWPQCPELKKPRLGLSQNGSKLWLWFCYAYVMVILVGKISFGYL